jgi:glycosyltransferase involved in cell wall biosynthesis
VAPVTTYGVLTTVHAGCDATALVLAMSSVRTAMVHSTHKGVHAVYVDGVIPDDIRTILSEIGTPASLVVSSPSRHGAAYGLNQLLTSLSDVDYVFIHDADDIMLPGRIDAQINHLETHPEWSFCGGQALEYHTENEDLRVLSYPNSPDAVLRAMSRRNPFAHSTVCFRARIFQAEGFRYDAVLPRVIDFDLFSRLLESGHVAGNIPEPVTILLVDHHFAKRRQWGYFRLEWAIYKVWLIRNRDWVGVFWVLLRAAARLFPRRVINALYAVRHRILH